MVFESKLDGFEIPKFYLVDLAGSHKHHSKTKAEALSREEIKINLDFLTLCNIIGTLGEDNSPIN